MTQGRAYTALGRVMDELARARDVRGPHRIAHYIEQRLGDSYGRPPSGQAVAKWMYGDAEPKLDKIRMFAEAFELDEAEKMDLALAYAYNKERPRTQ